MSTDDLEARERELRAKAGFDAPLQAKKKGRPRGPPPRSCAVLREDVPTHEREPPEGVTLTAPPDEHPLPAVAGGGRR